MARGGARPGAGRPARKSANTSTVSRRARTHARVGDVNQRPWPADKVERWAIDRLIPYAKNARTHTDAQVAAIAASIKEWGWTTPALVGEDGGLIAGHAKIPVMVAAGWTEAQKRAYVLADNQLAITGSGWDPELLRLELGELKLSGFDLSLTGADNQLAITGSGWDPELQPKPLAIRDASAAPACNPPCHTYVTSPGNSAQASRQSARSSLRLELGELKLSGFDLSLTGFGDLELKDLLADRDAGLTDPDDAPEAPEHPVNSASCSSGSHPDPVIAS